MLTGKDIGLTNKYKNYILCVEDTYGNTYYLGTFDDKHTDEDGNNLLMFYTSKDVFLNDSVNLSKKLIAGGGKCFNEAVKNIKNKFTVVPSKEKCLFVITDKSVNEADDELAKYEKMLFDGPRGGQIIFSTDVNSKDFSENKFKNFIIQKFKTFKNRFTAKKALDKIRRKNDIYAWTIGQYFQGVYTGNNGKTFTEDSIVIDIIGVEKKDIFKLAEEICKTFDQESVLVKVDNQVYFVS